MQRANSVFLIVWQGYCGMKKQICPPKQTQHTNHLIGSVLTQRPPGKSADPSKTLLSLLSSTREQPLYIISLFSNE